MVLAGQAVTDLTVCVASFPLHGFLSVCPLVFLESTPVKQVNRIAVITPVKQVNRVAVILGGFCEMRYCCYMSANRSGMVVRLKQSSLFPSFEGRARTFHGYTQIILTNYTHCLCLAFGQSCIYLCDELKSIQSDILNLQSVFNFWMTFSVTTM